MEDYEPRIIIRQEQYDEYLLNLHRHIGYFAENKDPPNPFRGLLEVGENLKIIVNDTNDLRFCIKHFEQKILDKELENVIIGDPHTFGYGEELIEKMLEDVSMPYSWIRDRQWISIMLNTNRNELVIEHGKIRVEK